MTVNGEFKNAVLSAVGTSAETLYTAPVGVDSLVMQLDIANILSTGVQVDVTLTKSGGSPVYMLKDVPVPAGSTLRVTESQKIVLEAEDLIQITASDVSAVDVVASFIEDINS